MSKLTNREKFNLSWIPEPNTGCWLWMGRINLAGYGQYYWRGINTQAAHRHAWFLYRGPIPEGLYIDHMCRVRSCVNPDHLRVVTPRVNTTENSIGIMALNVLKTHCPQGHVLDGVKRTGNRYCKTCMRLHNKAVWQRRKLARSLVPKARGWDGVSRGGAYTYLGDRLTDPALCGASCVAALRADGKCVTGRSAMLVLFHGEDVPRVVLRRQLRKPTDSNAQARGGRDGR